MPPLRFEEDLQRLLAKLAPPAKLIDCHVGHGTYTKRFQEEGFDVLSFESAHQFDQTTIPHRTVTAVWAGDSFECLARPITSQYISHVASVLVRGGYLAFNVREGDGVKRIKHQTMSGAREQVLYLYTPESIEHLLASTGFTTCDAWFSGPLECRRIHVIAQTV